MSMMKAACFYPPGGPEALRYEDVPIPTDLKPNEVLIKVHTASVIWPELTWPIYQHRETGEYKPQIVCHDFSGIVARVGAGAEGRDDLKVGSEVYAFTSGIFEHGLRMYDGAAAEYTVADMDSVLPKPKTMSLTEAATVPLSALTAWQALHDQAKLRKGQRFLVTGAGGATGIWAVQFAKMLGAHVIGTASSEWSFETLKAMGIDEIIDYKKQSIADATSDIDLVLDTVGGQRTVDELVQVLKPDGQIIDIVDYGVEEMVPKGVRARFFVVAMDRAELGEIGQLIDDGKLKTFIDSVFPLEKAQDAFRKGQAGHLQGKVVLSIMSSD